MVPVKIECECGQHYAFDVEPVNGQMPSAIACPGCGVDGTPHANAVIAQTLVVPPIPAFAPAPAPEALISIPPASGGLRLSASVHAETPAAHASMGLPKGAPHPSQLGLVSREQAEIEARAKISWGDSQDAVIKFLMIQGFSHAEASEMVTEMFKVRLAETRANGIRKTAVGGGMMCVPVIAFVCLLSIDIMPIKLMGVAIGRGLWGLFKVIQGLIMIVAPKMESG